ncbi:PRC-barrel domain-containing protein [Actinopolyspora lacussalsi subsp. righensis]|uniref:PRC-barrel domain-containing protein n=1 Tax=Actinopolyspora righensis TaxID=995060 RepID=A0A1I6Y738_9ACTN|nr:PRC-barrel domain-containing protein [Actinopolyspora righensis]SFT46051.1 PRC-barrel domain-containing protein [Actinopolyspora righensis]
MNDVPAAQDLIGNEVYDRDGSRIGRVGNVYVDDATHRPEWITVRSGPLGVRESFVPLGDAAAAEGALNLDVSREQVRTAPRVEAEHGHLSDEDGRRLREHYELAGVTVPEPRGSSTHDTAARTPEQREPHSGPRVVPAEAMTTSEFGRHHRPESEPRPGHLIPRPEDGTGGKHRKAD